MMEEVNGFLALACRKRWFEVVDALYHRMRMRGEDVERGSVVAKLLSVCLVDRLAKRAETAADWTKALEAFVVASEARGTPPWRDHKVLEVTLRVRRLRNLLFLKEKQSTELPYSFDHEDDAYARALRDEKLGFERDVLESSGLAGEVLAQNFEPLKSEIESVLEDLRRTLEEFDESLDNKTPPTGIRKDQLVLERKEPHRESEKRKFDDEFFDSDPKPRRDLKIGAGGKTFRARRKFSEEEVNELEGLLKKLGPQWALILEKSVVLKSRGRTAVDIKDKVRNMNKKKPTIDARDSEAFASSVETWCRQNLVRDPLSKVHVSALRDAYVKDQQKTEDQQKKAAELLNPKTYLSRLFRDTLLEVVGSPSLNQTCVIRGVNQLGIEGWTLLKRDVDLLLLEDEQPEEEPAATI